MNGTKSIPFTSLFKNKVDKLGIDDSFIFYHRGGMMVWEFNFWVKAVYGINLSQKD